MCIAVIITYSGFRYSNGARHLHSYTDHEYTMNDGTTTPKIVSDKTNGSGAAAKVPLVNTIKATDKVSIKRKYCAATATRYLLPK